MDYNEEVVHKYLTLLLKNLFYIQNNKHFTFNVGYQKFKNNNAFPVENP